MASIIVLAEDDSDIRELTTRLLRRAGHTVIAVPDGKAAWDAIGQQQPDLVVSDIDMPIMSGIDLCRQIRADHRTRSLPVLFVSGSLMPSDTRPEQAGATAILRKPFLPRELTACVEKMLQTGHTDGQSPTSCA
jgi:CheY-like chemotaxis protein